MAKASASNPYGVDDPSKVDRTGVMDNGFQAKGSSSKSSSSSSSSKSSSKSSGGSSRQHAVWEDDGDGGSYDASKPQGAKYDGPYDDTPSRPLDDAYYQKEQQYKQQYEEARANGDVEGMRAANDGMNQVRNDYGLAAQYANSDIQHIKNQTGYGSSSGGSGGGGSGGSGNGSAFSDEMRELLISWRDAAQEQHNAQIDYAVNQAVAELERAQADAQGQFKEQQEQVALDERQGMDNTALYAELRGDKGGIGKEQYSSVQNTAAQNRLAVSQAQTKLATDTARQIEDLRAQGEFQKADAALEIAQNYLAQLISLEQWAAEYNLSVAQFQTAVQQWEREFQASMDQFNANLELSKAELTGAFTDGTPTLSAKNQLTQQLAGMGESLLAAGVMPTAEQLSAMGMTEAQAKEYLNILALEKAQAAAQGSGGGSGGRSGGGSGSGDKDNQDEASSGEIIYRQLYDAGIRTTGDAYARLLEAGYTSTEADKLSGYFRDWLSDNADRLESQNREPDYGLQALQAELNHIQDTGNLNTVGERAANLVQSYYERGSITEETAKRLLAQYGLYA